MDLSCLWGVRAHPSHPPWLRAWTIYQFCVHCTRAKVLTFKAINKPSFKMIPRFFLLWINYFKPKKTWFIVTVTPCIPFFPHFGSFEMVTFNCHAKKNQNIHEIFPVLDCRFHCSFVVLIGVPGRSNLGGRRPVCPKKLRSARNAENSSRASNVSRSTAKTYSKTTTFISQVVFFTFKCFNSIAYRFFIARIFGHFARIFSKGAGGAAAPPAPLANTPMVVL